MSGWFQSQTGSQALSDAQPSRRNHRQHWSFNPKREARPSQTLTFTPHGGAFASVSIPNGKPGPLRHSGGGVGGGGRRRFQSQTGSQALSDEAAPAEDTMFVYRFNPKREARPSQTARRAEAGQR